MRPIHTLPIIQGLALAVLAAASLSCFALLAEGPASSGLIGLAGLGVLHNLMRSAP